MACAPVQAFEPRLSVALAKRWPALVAEVLAHDEERAWLLLADAGATLAEQGARPETWCGILGAYAELQRAEAAHVAQHLADGVPDMRLATLPARYAQLVDSELPVEIVEVEALRSFAPPFAELCAELAAHGVPETIQHDDLHASNVFVRDAEMRVLDWGDTSVAHPFISLVCTFSALELAPDDPAYALLRDAYLEPWGPGLAEAFELAQRVGAFARAIAWGRQRAFMRASDARGFDEWFAGVVRRAVARI
jgi:hypothetical protein